MCLVVGATLVAACNRNAKPPKPTLNDLVSALQNAAMAEPDPATKALLSANYKPFAIEQQLEGRQPYTAILFGQIGAKAADGHGSMAKPWISRELVGPPQNEAGYRAFNATPITISGDDWNEPKNQPRPTARPEANFRCWPTTLITPTSITEVVAAMRNHQPSNDISTVHDGVHFSCTKH